MAEGSEKESETGQGHAGAGAVSKTSVKVELDQGDAELLEKVRNSDSEEENRNKMNRERSKTPPAVISRSPCSSRLANPQGFGSFMEPNFTHIHKKTEEQNRDSGVHLDVDENGSGEIMPVNGGGGGGSVPVSVAGGDRDHDHEGEEDEGNHDDEEIDPSRRHSKSSSLPFGVKLCPESGGGSGSGSGGGGGDGDSDRWTSLEEELKKAQTELREKDAEVEILKGIRQQVEGELEDLTASLFEEAHKMVKEAKTKEASSEKSLKEAKMQLEGLQAEVAALKALLITSTPSRPNLGGSGGNGISLFKKQHKRTPSHNHLQYGRQEDENKGAEKEKPSEVVIDRSRCEVDPILLGHFAAWRVEPTLNREKSGFLCKMYTEDIDPCLAFADESLVIRLKKAIEDNSIWVEPLPEKDRNNVPKDCALLHCPRVCHYRMRFAFDSDEWFDISQICRDRVAAVCEFLNYLRYIKNGLVKASVEDAYWEMLRLRKQMAIAKLGISIS